MSRHRLDRRTFVTAAGTVSAIALAGCADSGPGGNETNNTTDGGGDDETYALTVTVENAQGAVEGAAVTLEQAGTDGVGGDGELGNESGNTTGTETGNESTNATAADGPSADNESTNETMADAGGMGNESGNESGNGTTGDGTAGVGTQRFPMEEETGRNGEVEFADLTSGEYTVIAENEGQRTEDTVTIDSSDEETTLTLGDASGNESGNMTGNESANATTGAGNETGT